MTSIVEPRRATPAVARRRLGITAAGTAAALAVWAVESAVMGAVRQPAFGAGSAPRALSAPAVIVVSLLAGLLAWGTLALTERVLHRRRVWAALAGAGLLLSLSGPLSGTGVTLGDRVALVLLHVVVAGVVVPLMYRTSAARPEEGRLR